MIVKIKSMRNFSIILGFFFMTGSAIAQSKDFQIQKETIQYYVDTTAYISSCFTIENNSSEDLFLWLDRIGRKEMSNELYRNYFLAPYGDFTLMQLLSEHLIDTFQIVLFKTFIKKVPPKSEFEIICNARVTKKKSRGQNVESHIIHFRASELPKTYLSILNSSDNKLFQPDKIVVEEGLFK